MTSLPSWMEMLRALVAAHSASHFDPARDEGNGPVIDLLASWTADLGFRVEVDRVPGASERFNLVATLGEGEGGLVLSGHSDTVGCEAVSWSQDPHVLTEREGRLYGLGVCDMKCFFAIALEALREVRAVDLREPVILVATADEECAMQGARDLVRRGRPRGRYAVLGEPTSLIPVRMHKGMMMESVKLEGKSGHSSDPRHGLSAVEAMMRVAGALLSYRDELRQRCFDSGFAYPHPTLNLGSVHGGDHPNRICADCELQLDLRPLPGMTVAEAREEVHQRIHSSLEDWPGRCLVQPLFAGIDPMVTASSSQVVRVAEELTGHAAESVAYGTEAPFFTALGMECLLLGAADIAQAHQPDEYVEVKRIEPAIRILRALVQRLCVD